MGSSVTGQSLVSHWHWVIAHLPAACPRYLDVALCGQGEAHRTLRAAVDVDVWRRDH